MLREGQGLLTGKVHIPGNTGRARQGPRCPLCFLSLLPSPAFLYPLLSLSFISSQITGFFEKQTIKVVRAQVLVTNGISVPLQMEDGL